ncbi:hypothetical protein PENTCL1PPCAC_497, partial [Pristionchus entomophagus]
DVIILIWILFTATVLTVNVLLLVLMIRHTPKSFANFGIVMKFHVVSDLQTIIAAAVVMNRTVTIDNAFVYIAYGPCKWVSSTFCFQSYGLMTMGGSMTLYIVLVSFIVRLQIMRNRKPSDRSIIILLSMLSFPVPTAILVLFLSSRSEDSIMINILQEHLPEYADRDAMIYGIADVRIPTMASALAMMIVAIIPLYFVILHLRSMIIKCLNDAGSFLSDKTKAMHSQFVKMLTLQCVVPPAVFVLTMVPNELKYYDAVRHPLVEAMINIVR